MSDEYMLLEQLETWEQAFKEGQTLAREAATRLNHAHEANMARRWRDAIAMFQQARETYAKAIKALSIPATIEDTSYKAITSMREEAGKLLRQAQSAIQELDNEHWLEMCEQNIDTALEFMQQAKQMLNDGNLANARLLARHAGEIDPTLWEEANQMIQEIDKVEAARKSPTQKLILLILIIALILLLVIFGPQLWEGVSPLLFPSGILFLSVLR